MKNMKSRTLRMLAMLIVLVIVAVGYFTTTGIGNTCGVGFGDITLLCPLGALTSMLAGKAALPVAIVSIVVTFVVCMLLGKVFCAWVCPAHFLSPAKKQKGRVRLCTKAACATCSGGCGKKGGVHLDGRHVVLAAALVSSLVFGYPVFCLACPVGLSFATVLLVMQLFAFGKTTWTILVFPLIVAVELFVLPRWCHNLCPLGALLSLFSAANKTFRPRIDAGKCLQSDGKTVCNLCVEACPEGIDLHDISAGRTTLSDCSKCRACADACPKGAIRFPFLAPRGGEGQAACTSACAQGCTGHAPSAPGSGAADGAGMRGADGSGEMKACEDTVSDGADGEVG
jgi:ferredoxin-type protein NapH